MGNIYFALKNNANTKKHIESIQNLIQNKKAKLDVRGEEKDSIIFLDIETNYDLLSYIRRNSSNTLELAIFIKGNLYSMVDIPMKDIELVYSL